MDLKICLLFLLIICMCQEQGKRCIITKVAKNAFIFYIINKFIYYKLLAKKVKSK